MKITVNKSEFLSKLIAVSKVAADNKIRPVLGCVKLTANDKITMTATDLELTITAEVEGTTELSGTAVFKADKVIEYVSTLDNGNITIELVNNILNIYEAEFAVMDADEYPNIKIPTEINRIEIESNKLLKCLKGCISVSKTVADNVTLSGVRVELSDKMRCIASDSFRMAYFEADVQSDKEIKITIPNNAVFRIIDLIKNTEKVTAFISDNNICFNVDGYILTSRLINLEFPNWESITRGFSSNKTVTINKTDAIKMLKRITIFARENLTAKNGVTFETERNVIKVKAVAGSAKARDKINAITEGENIKINLNAQFIIDYLNTIDTEAVDIKMSGSANPVMIKPCNSYNTWFICMPLALAD